MQPLLSIVIPTLNRCEYLKRTLDCLLPQIETRLDDVELVVCCNASKDGTDDYMQQLSKKCAFIRYKYFDEYVEVGYSLIRSVGEARGIFVVLWGDDDVPMPFFVETILNVIQKNPDVGIIHCNRLYGKDALYGIRDLRIQERFIDSEEKNIFSMREFVERFTISLGFISSLVFKKDGWDKGVPFYSDQYFGYEHLSIIINGNRDCDCYYIPYPLEIQRFPYQKDFAVKWPWFRFVGVPNMMADFDKNGVTENALQNWHKTKNESFFDFVWNMMYCTQDKPFFKPRCKELNKYQKSIFRRILTYMIVYFFPGKVFSILKKKLYK